MNKTRFLRNILCIVLSLTFLCGTLTPLSASAASSYNVNFGEPYGNNNISLSPSEMMELLFPGQADENEKLYVDTYFGEHFIYGASIGAENVDIDIDGSQLIVYPRAKAFVASNGVTVNWFPAAVTYENETKPVELSASRYSCTFDLAESASVKVMYTAAIDVPYAYAETLGSFAYNDTSEAKRIKDTYAAAYAEYLAANQRYQDYLTARTEYQKALNAYNAYVEQKRLYDKNLASFESYKKLEEQYQKDLAVYQKYEQELAKYKEELVVYNEQYKQFEIDRNNYNTAKKEYETAVVNYQKNLDKLQVSMAAIDSIFTTPSDTRFGMLFPALQNADIIRMIESQENTLINSYNIKKTDIDYMRKTSDELVELLKEYDAIRKELAEANKASPQDKALISSLEEKKFLYYKEHYTEISCKFNDLYDKMTAILKPSVFVMAGRVFDLEYKNDTAEAERKKKRVLNVLCQIYMVCQALDDTSTRADTWEFYDYKHGDKKTYYFTDLIAQNLISLLTDTNSSSPAGLEWMDEGSLPTIPEPPTAPIAPVAPTPVNKPTAPAVVKDPGQAPTEVKHPGTAPTPVSAPTPPASVDNNYLILRTNKYFGDTVKQKHTVSASALKLTFEQTLIRAFDVNGDRINTYYDYDGSVWDICKGEPSGTPTRPYADGYDYTFKGWEDKGQGIYYAVYKGTLRTYTITFKNGDEVLSTVTCKHGETPAYSGATPQKESSADKVYTFVGWDSQLLPAKGDTTYEASFSEADRIYKITWTILDKTEFTLLPYGAVFTLPEIEKPIEYLGGAVREFTGWDHELTSVQGDITYTALFKVTPLVVLPETEETAPTVEKNGDEYTVTVSGNSAGISGILERAAGEESSEIVISMGGVTLYVDNSTAVKLKDAGAVHLSILRPLARKAIDGVGYILTDKDGNTVSFDGTLPMTLPNTYTDPTNLYIGYTSVYGTSSGIIEQIELGDGTVIFDAAPSMLYSVGKKYSVTTQSTEGGNLILSGDMLYKVGDTVSFEIKPDIGYTVSKITYTDSEGNVFDITRERSFIMIESNVIISAEFEKKPDPVIPEVTVTFKYQNENGEEVIETQTLSLGAQIVIPEIPKMFEKDGYTYHFTGWDVQPFKATESKTYTAQYQSVKTEEKQELSVESASNATILDQLLPIMILGTLLLASIALLVIVSIKAVKHNKGRKNRNK